MPPSRPTFQYISALIRALRECSVIRFNIEVLMIFSAQLTSRTSMRSVHSTSWLKTPLITDLKAGSSRVMRQPQTRS